MRFAIIGVGGVGGSLGAALLRAGHDVLFVARGENARALAERGLTVQHERLPFRARRIDVTSDPSRQPLADAALLCVKCYDLDQAIGAHAEWLASCGSVITLQNGLEAPKIAAALLPARTVLGGTVQVVAKLLEPGVILREGETLLLNLAEPSGELSERLHSLKDAIAPTEIAAEIHHNMQTMLWLKFLMVACSSSINVAMRSGFDAMASNPAMPWLLEIAMQEALGVARALDIPLPSEIEAQTRTTLRNVFAHGGKASLLTDLERGRPLELEWLSGAIHRMGAQAGVPTPLHTAIYHALLPLASGLREARPSACVVNSRRAKQPGGRVP